MKLYNRKLITSNFSKYNGLKYKRYNNTVVPILYDTKHDDIVLLNLTPNKYIDKKYMLESSNGFILVVSDTCHDLIKK